MRSCRSSVVAPCSAPSVVPARRSMFLRSMHPRAMARLCHTAPAAGISEKLPQTLQASLSRSRKGYSSTRRVEMNYLPMVLESTPRGERAYDIYSRLLRVCFGLAWTGVDSYFVDQLTVWRSDRPHMEHRGATESRLQVAACRPTGSSLRCSLKQAHAWRWPVPLAFES